MTPSFHILIDESGDQGFRFESPDCSRWFIVSGVIALSCAGPAMAEVIKGIKASIGWNPRFPLHFKDVKGDERRRMVIGGLTSQQTLYRAVTVLISKDCLSNRESFNEKNRLFFYATRFLLERASWMCRSSKEFRLRQHGDGTAKVIFSNMGEISKLQICEYFDRLRATETAIDWSVICSSRFETLSPGGHAGLQIADCVASGFYCAEQHKGKNKTDEWARLLKPMMYRSERGKYLGYGLKFYPETEIAQSGKALWAKQFYT